MTPLSQIKLLSNVDIAAAEAFLLAVKASSVTLQSIQNALLDADGARDKVLWEEKKRGSTGATVLAATTPSEGTADEGISSAFRVIRFDETSGAQLTRQQSFEEPSVTTQVDKLPWKECHSTMSSALGAKRRRLKATRKDSLSVSTQFAHMWETGTAIQVYLGTMKPHPTPRYPQQLLLVVASSCILLMHARFPQPVWQWI